ncbi:UNVERIFIED_CONTAM: hypothetical protein Scaly_2659800 [Sesamum calycinum]|uniref:Gag-pol polyprotein n=1 Tax=Sesamum calycinum TaxID=2727403 RepID=A0AAW2J7T0_9LAMI
MIEEASARAASRAIEQYVTQHAIPLQPPHHAYRGHGVDLAPGNNGPGQAGQADDRLDEEVESRPSLSNQPQEGNSRPAREGREREDKQNKPNQDNLPTAGIIGVISGGPAGGDSARARKTALKAIENTSRDTFEPAMMMNEESQEKQYIVFGSQELERDVVANNDAVVISATIANFWVKRVLVDSGSSVNIIFYKAFSQMGINNAELTRINTP